VEIRLSRPDESVFKRLITGYSSSHTYLVNKQEEAEWTRFELRLVSLERPFTKRYPELDVATCSRYVDIASEGHTFGAFEGEECIGLALAELYSWNGSLWIHEFHIASEFRRQGIGRRLMQQVISHANEVPQLRSLGCETQTSNVPAIQFYRGMGFCIDGIDVSLYSNEDQERGEVAIFMKKRLLQPETGPTG
jgi:ribosomal protein S18 acetylase RimI-like enzyme